MSIASQLTEIQNLFTPVVEEIFPDVRRYAKEVVGLNRTQMIDASDIQLREHSWGLRSLTVEMFDEDSFSIPFDYFDDVEGYIAAAKALKEEETQAKRKRELLEAQSDLTLQLSQIKESLAKING